MDKKKKLYCTHKHLHFGFIPFAEAIGLKGTPYAANCLDCGHIFYGKTEKSAGNKAKNNPIEFDLMEEVDEI